MFIKPLYYNCKKHKDEMGAILDFLKRNREPDFYLTKNNQRLYVNDSKTLRKFLKECIITYVHRDRETGEVTGVVSVWKGIGGTTKRFYIKMSALNSDVIRDVLIVLFWRTNFELYAKLRKDSPFLNILRNKGFKWFHGRGK